ncbi:hypothetical protein IAR55_000115 [Kwoniella newhampshirensis]|uniref:Uncharacterized protein n=1 Tax=Kwoniella newhampshirensis TaxID=1651941 RepID=A0AAW0Z5U2_9TREE
MVSGLELRTSPSTPPVSSTPAVGPSTTATTSVGKYLPSFDALIRSLGSEVDHPHHAHHMHHLHEHHHPHGAPYPSLHRHHPHLHEMIHRPPSTPPTPSTHSHTPQHLGVHHHYSRGRPRSNSVPAISRTHLTSPFKGDNTLYDDHSTEHHGDRIKALREGDGEWNTWSLNAVVPVSLPYHARPHFHPRASTGSVPITIQTTQHNHNPLLSPSHSPLHQLHDRSTETYFPSFPPRDQILAQPIPIHRPVPHPRRSLSIGSHSPLSVNDPLTPQSLRGVYENETTGVDVESDCSRRPTPTPMSIKGCERE